MNIDQVKSVADVSAFGVAAATLMQWLPPIAAFLSIVWLIMQMAMNWTKLTTEIKTWFKKDKK